MQILLAVLNVVGTMPATVAANITPPFPWLDTTVPRTERVARLIGAMNSSEKIAQLVVDTPALPHLGVHAYHWR